MIEDRRIELLKEVIRLNEQEVNNINKVASESRKPMSSENRVRVIKLRSANNSLRQKIKLYYD